MAVVGCWWSLVVGGPKLPKRKYVRKQGKSRRRREEIQIFVDICFVLSPLVSDVVESRLVSVKSRSVFVLIFTVLAFC